MTLNPLALWRRIVAPIPRFKRLSSLHTLDNDARFLAMRGSRRSELVRILRIGVEFIRGFRSMHFLGPTVSIFGSARFKEDHPYYDRTRKLAARIAEAGFVVMTGGGPGLMEAANRGAKDVSGFSVGATIALPFETKPNDFVDRVVHFYYFFIRKVMLIRYSFGFVNVPGGFGTLDELTEALNLIQTGKLYDFPVILYGKDYWQGFYDWTRDVLLKQKAVSQEDFERLVLTDDDAEVVRVLTENAKRLGLPLKQLPNR